MARCFWNQLCDCPDNTPNGAACTEHGGLSCSILNGVVVTTSNQITDLNTQMLEAGVAGVDADNARLDAIKVQVESRKALLEQYEAEVQALESDAQSAGLLRRRQIAIRINGIRNAVSGWEVDGARWSNAVDAIAQRPDSAIMRGLALLQRPYTNGGFCACDTEKARRLQAIDGLITADLALYPRQQAIAANLHQAVLWMLGMGVFIVGLMIRFAWLGFIVRRLLLSSITGLLLLLAVLLVVMATILLLTIASRRVLATRRRLLVEILEYYRLQQIPVCQPPGEGGATDGGDSDSWWERLLEELFGALNLNEEDEWERFLDESFGPLGPDEPEEQE